MPNVNNSCDTVKYETSHALKAIQSTTGEWIYHKQAYPQTKQVF